MANKRFFQFLFSKQPKLTMINGLVPIGATGAVGTVSGAGVQGVTRLAAGIYKIKLLDNYYGYVDSDFSMQGGITGSSVAGGAFITGTLYQIITLGTTTQAQWVTAGFDADYTAAVGSVFVATGAGAGTGTVKAIGSSGIVACEIAQRTGNLLNNLNSISNKGSSVIVQTLAATSSSVTTLIPTDPANGSVLSFKLWFKDSSVTAI